MWWLLIWIDCVELKTQQKGKVQVWGWLFWLIKASELLDISLSLLKPVCHCMIGVLGIGEGGSYENLCIVNWWHDLVK